VSTYQPYRSFTPSAITDQIWKSLMAQTNNPIQAAGIMGNIGIESSFDPNIINEDEDAYGLLQLRNDRRDNYDLFDEANPELSEVEKQIRFIFEQGDPDSQYKDAIAAKYWSEIMGQTNPESVARLFDKRFERSGGWLVDPSDSSKGYNQFGTSTMDRMNLAKDIYGYYTGQDTELDGITVRPPGTNTPPNKKQSLIGTLRDKMTDPDFSDDLRLWANSMRLKPDQNLALAIIEGKKMREEKRLLALSKTESMKYINSLPEGSEKNMALAAIKAGTEMKDVIAMLMNNRNKVMDTEIKLEQNYIKDPTVKGFIGRADSLRTILSNARDPSQAGDIAIVFTYMKMLDPNSTVNKGELALAQNTGNLFQKGWSIYNSLIAGTSNLTDTQRQGLVNAAKNTYDESKTAYQATYDHYLDKAERYELNADNFVRKFGLNDEQYTSLEGLVEGFDPNQSWRDDGSVEVPFTQQQFNEDVFGDYLESIAQTRIDNNDLNMSVNEWMDQNFNNLDSEARFNLFKNLYIQTIRSGNQDFNVNHFLRN